MTRTTVLLLTLLSTLLAAACGGDGAPPTEPAEPTITITGVEDGGSYTDVVTIVISVTSDRAKWKNAVRQPKIALLVPDGRKQLIVYGTAEGISETEARNAGTKRIRARMGREVTVSDEELTRQALAADPDAPIDPDAEPFAFGERGAGLLPEWYMPAVGASAASSRSRRRRAWVVGAVVVGLVVVNGAGLCVTYGVPEIAW